MKNIFNFGTFFILAIIGCVFLVGYMETKDDPKQDNICTIVTHGETYNNVKFEDIGFNRYEPVSFLYNGKLIYVSDFKITCDK